MFRRNVIALVGAAFALAACATTWKTDYNGLPAGTSANWRVAEIEVDVPRSLSVSEVNTLAPNADIVWRGDPPGDRYKQIEAIFEEGIRRGSQGLNGSRPVVIQATVAQFHAMTDRAVIALTSSGVHDIVFGMQVLDQRTGEVLAVESTILAHLPAYVGVQARQAQAAGQTQKVRITQHISQVTAGWLGLGPDPRTEFVRRGR